jgi:hypothetical protein
MRRLEHVRGIVGGTWHVATRKRSLLFPIPDKYQCDNRALYAAYSPRFGAISIRRVLRSMTKRTKYRTRPNRVIASTLKKSVAAILGNDVSSPALSLQERFP